MIKPKNCPYKDIDVCSKCQFYNFDTDACNGLVSVADVTNSNSPQDFSASSASSASTYEERYNRYLEERQKLLQLSKEQLVDLIIHAPTMF